MRLPRPLSGAFTALYTPFSADGSVVNLRDKDDEVFRAAEELGINISTRFESSSIDEI